MKKLFSFSTWLLGAALACTVGHAQERAYEDKLGAGDTVRIQVFQNPDLTLETRIQESGDVTYPLIGALHLAGLTIPQAEKLLAAALKTGGFMQQPQVNISQVQARPKQMSVLGQVLKPGLYPLEFSNTHLSDVLAQAGGIGPGGADTVIVIGRRQGKPIRQQIDVTAMYLQGDMSNDILIAPGDLVYVNRAPVFYIYGEAQRPGSFRIERNMTFMQALATAGGPTQRGTEKQLRVRRQGADGKWMEVTPELTDLVQTDDVIFVRESLF